MAVVALNFGANAATMALPADTIKPAATFERIFGEGNVRIEADHAIVEVPAERAVVFRMR